jgi:hypothetical protein
MRLKTLFLIFVLIAAAGFAAGYFFAAPLRGGLISAAALIAAFVALVVGLVSPIVAYQQAKAAQIAANAAMSTAQSAGARALANVRLQWLQTLRDTLSEYHSILMSSEDEPPDADETAKAKTKEKAEADDRRLSYLGTQLDLLLNQKKKYQQVLWKVSDDILNMKTKNERQAADERLVVAARETLDFHWRKIKAEILSNEPLREPPSS